MEEVMKNVRKIISALIVVLIAIALTGCGKTLGDLTGNNAAGAAKPAAPINVVGTGGENQVQLNWTAVPNATMYRVYRGLPGVDNDPQLVSQIATATNEYMTTDVAAGSYIYYVSALNALNQESDRTEASPSPVIVTDSAPPAAETAPPAAETTAPEEASTAVPAAPAAVIDYDALAKAMAPYMSGGNQTPPSSPQGDGNQPPVVTGESFNPKLFDAQSCDPEQNADGGCSWDVGIHQDQVGIVKGVDISWAKGGKSADPNNRCEFVVLRPNSWFENLNVKDARLEVYTVWTGDLQGWLKTLAVQGAAEQAADYGCPGWTFETIPQWGSDITSPPPGVPGFNNPAGGTGSVAPQGNAGEAVQNTTGTGNTGSDTPNGKPRRTSADAGGTATFEAGESVYGYTIIMGGKTYTDCFIPNTSAGGTVKDGVVNYWAAEVTKAKACQ